MPFKAKLRKIGNSLGILIPKDVITGLGVGDEIELDVIGLAEGSYNIPARRNTKSVEFIKQYKQTHCCEICGEVREPCLQFHHKDSTQKLFNVGQGNGHYLKDVKKEVEKCRMLCANCHFILHSTKQLVITPSNILKQPVAPHLKDVDSFATADTVFPEQLCRYCGLPADEPSPQCRRH